MLYCSNVNSSTESGTVSTVSKGVRGYRYKYKATRHSTDVMVVGADKARHLCGILEFAENEEEAVRILSRMKKDKRIVNPQIAKVNSGVSTFRK